MTTKHLTPIFYFKEGDDEPEASNYNGYIRINISTNEMFLSDGTTWNLIGSGGDVLKLDELAAPTDITTLNSTVSEHGLLPKLSSTPLQVLRINSAGNNSEWASLINQRVGKSQADGGGTSFVIEHGFGSAPAYVFVQLYSHRILISWTWDATEITVTTDEATPSGTDNVLIVWMVM